MVQSCGLVEAVHANSQKRNHESPEGHVSSLAILKEHRHFLVPNAAVALAQQVVHFDAVKSVNDEGCMKEGEK